LVSPTIGRVVGSELVEGAARSGAGTTRRGQGKENVLVTSIASAPFSTGAIDWLVASEIIIIKILIYMHALSRIMMHDAMIIINCVIITCPCDK
jgi:hypothetical protein